MSLRQALSGNDYPGKDGKIMRLFLKLLLMKQWKKQDRSSRNTTSSNKPRIDRKRTWQEKEATMLKLLRTRFFFDSNHKDGASPLPLPSSESSKAPSKKVLEVCEMILCFTVLKLSCRRTIHQRVIHMS